MSDTIETKHELMLELTSGASRTPIDSLPERPLSHAEVADLEDAYGSEADRSEAWVIDLAGGGQTAAAMDEQGYDDDQTVLTFALLVDDTWKPFQFGDGTWFQTDPVPHSSTVDLDEELNLGSMQRVAELR